MHLIVPRLSIPDRNDTQLSARRPEMTKVLFPGPRLITMAGTRIDATSSRRSPARNRRRADVVRVRSAAGAIGRRPDPADERPTSLCISRVHVSAGAILYVLSAASRLETVRWMRIIPKAIWLQRRSICLPAPLPSQVAATGREPAPLAGYRRAGPAAALTRQTSRRGENFDILEWTRKSVLSRY